MEFFSKFPVMERQALAELRKGIDFVFRDFSRSYGDHIEAFFDPILFFLVRFEKLMINSPWPIIIIIIGQGELIIIFSNLTKKNNIGSKKASIPSPYDLEKSLKTKSIPFLNSARADLSMTGNFVKNSI